MSEAEGTSDETAASRRISTRAFTIGAVLTALLLACVASIWASPLPDGLSYVADASGIAAAADPSATSGSPLAQYGVLSVDNPWLSLVIAGAIGCAVTFGLAWILGRVAKRRRTGG